MATQYQTVAEHDLGGGIDVRSSENLLQPGFFEDILNGDVISQRVKKRVGYQQECGYLPVRVKQLTYNTDLTDNIRLDLDSSIDLANIPTTPIIVQGRTSNGTEGDFLDTTDSLHYYSAFSADPRQDLSSPDGTLSLSQSNHGFDSNLLFVGVTESLSTSDFSHQIFLPDAVRVNKATLAVDIDYTTASSNSGLVYFSDKQAVGGQTYVHSNTAIASGATVTIPVAAGTHGLSNFNILVKAYQETATEFIEILPDMVTLDKSTGSVSVTITNSTGATIDIFPVLTVTSPEKISVGSVAGSTSLTISIPNFVEKFPFLGIYMEQTAGGDILEQVVPDIIAYDDSTETVSITFTNSSASSANFEIYYDSGNIITNQLFVSGATVASEFTDTDPQLTIWGLNHEEIYANSTSREGWVNHVDTYRRSAEERLISGLGGNLFAARTYEEVGSSFSLPRLYPRLNARVEDDLTVGPLFYGTGDLPGRTRGYITSEESGSNWGEVDSVSYNETTGYAEYLITVTNLGIFDSNGNVTTIDQVVSTVSNEEDYLTVRDMGWARHNGTFRIAEVTQVDATTLKFAVDNENLKCVDFDEVDAGGLAGVFTDQIDLLSTSEFVKGDTLGSELFTDAFIVKVLTSSTNVVVAEGFVSPLSVPGGLRIQGTRTSSIIPLRTGSNVRSIQDIVSGDMLDYALLQRNFRVNYVNVQGDRTVSFSGDGETITVTFTSGNTSDLIEGGNIFFLAAEKYSGQHTISKVVDDTTIELVGTISQTTTGIMPGQYVELDETFEWTDAINNSSTLTVPCRWIPIEAPTDDFECTPSTHIHHFDEASYVDQEFLRSTMVNDNMYFVNGNDEVMKFDGENVYRAGLFRWQPGVFATLDNSQPGKIVTNTPSVSITGVEENQFTVAIGDESKYLIGDRIRHDDASTTEDYVITKIEDGRLTVNRDIEGGSTGTVTGITTYKYYFRLNAVDANNNLVASAVTGSEDFRIDVGEDTSINLQLVGMPSWDIYDYDRLEVEIYRTIGFSRADQAVFYRVTNLPLSFNKNDGYIRFVDTIQDEELLSNEVDYTADLTGDLAKQVVMSEPQRAKYVTSSGNRLILANTTDYPQLDVQLYDQNNLTQVSDLHNILWKFRTNNLESATISATDMVSTARYEWLDVDQVTPLTLGAITLDTATVTIDVGTPLAAGNWIYVYHSDKGPANTTNLLGWHQVISAAGNVVTINYKNTGTEVITANVALIATNATDIPVLIGLDGNRDTRADSNASILKAMSSATIRLAEAINCSMRVCQTEGFVPWMIANAGNEFNAGQLLLRQPRVDTLVAEMEIATNLPTDFDVFVNGLRRSADAQVSMTERVYPSRVIQSYPNFPEIFDNPNTLFDEATVNVRDVNSADGQEITGVIPFFGDSTSQDSQKEGMLVAFKTNSIYVYNVSNPNDPQRLETQGLGCTAPYSIAPSKDGIMFANNSGIYSITRSLRFRYLGEKMERNWLEKVNRNQLALVQGHNFALNRQYKLSLPVSGQSANSEVYVYDHTRETLDTPGGWSRYDNHPVTGWANTQSNAFFSSTKGRVFGIRNTGTASDYRDDNVAISWDAIYRAMDFGDAGARKTLIAIVSHFRNIADSDNTKLHVSTNLSQSFESTDLFSLDKDEEDTLLSDLSNQSIISIRSSVDRRKFLYLQVRYTNTGIDEPVELAGVDFRASLLSHKGLKEAADT